LAVSSPAQAPQRPPWTRADWIFLATLLGVTFLCYLPALGYDFVYDDRLLILKNPQLLSWRFVPMFFREHFIAPVFPNAPANYYRPLLLIWMLLNRQVWGVSAAGWHLTALALHLAVAAELFLVARRILSGRFAAGAAAAVFALHPVHVECVAWVMGMTESFSAAFLLGSLLCYLRARDPVPRSRGWYFASVFLFAGALLAKENMIVLPALLVAWEFFLGPVGRDAADSRAFVRRTLRSLRPAIPHFIVAALYLGVRLLVLGALSHAAIALPLTTQLATLPLTVLSYFKLVVWPVGLSAFYDVPYVTTFASRAFVLPLAADGVALVLLGAWAWKSRRAGCAAVWLLVPLLPLLNLTVFPQGEIVHDRYLYLSSMGLALLAGLALGAIPEKRSDTRGDLSGRLIASGVLLGLLGGATCYYRDFWKDNMTLFGRGVAVAPLNNIAANNLANEFVARGQYKEAVPLYRRVLARDPAFAMSVYNLGLCYYNLGELDQAGRYLLQAVALGPSDPDAYIHLGMTYLKMNRLDAAEHAVRRAIALEPNGRGFHLALGIILEQRGELLGALDEVRAELANYPSEPAASAELQQLERRLKK
jgi:tetratricopeptide (TPR) repeat protein